MMKRFLKRIFVLMCAFFTCFVFASCKEVTYNEESGKLIIGMECDYAPFNYSETKKTDRNVSVFGEKNLYVDGYDVEIAKRIANYLNKELIIKKISFTGLIPSLQSGDIDLIIAGMSPTDLRKESINFTDEYYSSEHVVVVRKDSKYSNAEYFSDFKGAKIVGQIGTSYDDLSKELATKSEGFYETPLDKIPMIVSSIISGVNDATVLEKPAAEGICKTNNELTYVKLKDNFDVDEVLLKVSVGVRKSDASLLTRINEALNGITLEEREQIMEMICEGLE